MTPECQDNGPRAGEGADQKCRDPRLCQSFERRRIRNDLSASAGFPDTVLGAGPAALGIIEGVAETTASLLKLYSGYLSDRVRKRKGWIVAGYSLSNIIRPLIAFSTSWVHVLTLRFSDRVGKGLRTSPRDAIIADSTPLEFRGKAYGFHRAMDHAGAIMGPLAATGLLFLCPGDLKTIFLLSFIPGLLAVVCFCSVSRRNSLRTVRHASGRASASGPPGMRCPGLQEISRRHPRLHARKFHGCVSAASRTAVRRPGRASAH